MATMKLMAGNKFVPVEVREDGSYYYLSWKWNEDLKAEVKDMQGARWMGYDEVNPTKEWRINKSPRNEFQLSYLRGENPYAWYDRPLEKPELTPRMTIKGLIHPYEHQKDMVWQGLTYHQTILAAEMGTGKTLASIYIMEMSKIRDWWYIGTKSSLASVRAEFRFWRSDIWPPTYTYDEIKRIIANWPKGQKPPQGVIADEISRAKTPTSQRSQALEHLFNAMRLEYGENAYIIEMSGSPASKDPTDWWNLCELARPGYLKEGSKDKLKYRLAMIEQKESLSGGSYPKLITWRDSELKCGICGQPKDSHKPPTVFTKNACTFIPMVNEVAKLYRRMSGLVMVKLKKDCLDLPEKVYKTIICEPDKALLRTAKLIKAGAKRAIEALTLMRELSDGFQYREKVLKVENCVLCVDGYTQGTETTEEKIVCHACSGTGKIRTVERETIEVECAKDIALLDILEDHEEDGRLVVYAGFTASIDRCEKLIKKANWQFIRFDGHGLKTNLEETGKVQSLEHLVEQFQTKDNRKICFLGHPGSAGMGLTLTASRSICYFSNDFNFDSRGQSEDRIHRIGMDRERGATIIDIINLPSDELVLKNLLLKRTLQSISLGELEDSLRENNEPITR